MYTVSVTVRGTAPLLQHRFPVPEFGNLSKGGRKSTGAIDYSTEWKEYFYSNGGKIYQPSSHIEGALIKAAAGFKIAGKRGRSYKDLFSAAILIDPERIPHNMDVPEELDADADKPLYLDVRPVVVQRARIVRVRPAFRAGWELSFEITVSDDEVQPDLLQDVLILAGRSVGIGDFRPKFGRFAVVEFKTHK